MSLTFTKQPDALVLSGNRIPVQIECNNALGIDTMLKFAIIYMRHDNYPIDGHWLRFTFSDKVVYYTFKDTISDIYSELPVKLISENHKAYTERIAIQLAKNIDIWERTSVHYQPEGDDSGSYITFKPRTKYNTLTIAATYSDAYHNDMDETSIDTVLILRQFTNYNDLLQMMYSRNDERLPDSIWYNNSGLFLVPVTPQAYRTNYIIFSKLAKRIYLRLTKAKEIYGSMADDSNTLYTKIDLAFDVAENTLKEELLVTVEGLNALDANLVLPTSPAVSTAIATASLQNIIQKDLIGHYTLGDFATTQHLGLTESFNLQAYVQDIDSSKLSDAIFSSSFYVLYSGLLPEYFQRKLIAADTTFWQWLNSKKFLHLRADATSVNVKTDIYSPERLYFIKTADVTDVKITLTYSDATTEEFLSDVSTVTDMNVVEFNASWLQISKLSDTWQSKLIVGYSIALVLDNGPVVSATFNYTFLTKYEPYARYFLFKNTLGVYECIRTTGKAAFTSDINKDLMNIDIPAMPTADYRKYKQINESSNNTCELSTGWIENPDANRYLEFFRSADVLWLKRGLAYPVSIAGGKHKLKDDDHNLVGFEFTMTVSDIDEDLLQGFNFEPDIPVVVPGDYNNDFNEDFFN